MAMRHISAVISQDCEPSSIPGRMWVWMSTMKAIDIAA
jgi:hypothetical protein